MQQALGPKETKKETATAPAGVCYGFCSYAVRVSREQENFGEKTSPLQLQLQPQPQPQRQQSQPSTQLEKKMFWLPLPLSAVLLLVQAQQKCFVFLCVSACWRGRFKALATAEPFSVANEPTVVCTVYWVKCSGVFFYWGNRRTFLFIRLLAGFLCSWGSNWHESFSRAITIHVNSLKQGPRPCRILSDQIVLLGICFVGGSPLLQVAKVI